MQIDPLQKLKSFIAPLEDNEKSAIEEVQARFRRAIYGRDRANNNIHQLINSFQEFVSSHEQILLSQFSQDEINNWQKQIEKYQKDIDEYLKTVKGDKYVKNFKIYNSNDAEIQIPVNPSIVIEHIKAALKSIKLQNLNYDEEFKEQMFKVDRDLQKIESQQNKFKEEFDKNLKDIKEQPVEEVIDKVNKFQVESLSDEEFQNQITEIGLFFKSYSGFIKSKFEELSKVDGTKEGQKIKAEIIGHMQMAINQVSGYLPKSIRNFVIPEDISLQNLYQIASQLNEQAESISKMGNLYNDQFVKSKKGKFKDYANYSKDIDPENYENTKDYFVDRSLTAYLRIQKESVESTFSSTEKAREELAKAITDLTFTQTIAKTSVAYKLVNSGIDYKNLPPLELLALANFLEEEVKTSPISNTKSNLISKAQALAISYKKSKVDYERFNKDQEYLGISGENKYKVHTPWENLAHVSYINDEKQTFKDYEFDTGETKSSRVAQLVAAADIETSSSTVLPIRDEEIEKLERLGVLDRDGHYVNSRIIQIKELAKKEKKELTVQEQAVVNDLEEVERRISARAYSAEMKSRNLAPFIETFLDLLPPVDKYLLTHENNKVGSPDNKKEAAQILAEMMVESDFFSIGEYTAGVAKDLPQDKEGKSVQIIADKTDKYIQTKLNKSTLEERARRVVNDLLADPQFIKFKAGFKDGELLEMSNDWVKALSNAQYDLLANGSLVPISDARFTFTGTQEIGKLSETIVRKGTSLTDELEKRNSTKEDIPTSGSSTAQTVTKAQKQLAEQHIETYEKVFISAPSKSQFYKAFPEANKITSFAGEIIDKEKAYRKYLREVDSDNENSEKDKEASGVGDIYSGLDLTNYLDATLRGGDKYIIWKKNREAQNEGVRKLKFWNTVEKIPIVGGKLAGFHEGWDELVNVLPEDWKKGWQGKGNDLINEGKINPILPSLLSAKNRKQEIILTNLAKSLGVISENLEEGDQKRYVGRFVNSILGRSGEYKGMKFVKGEGIAGIPFLTSGVPIIRPVIYAKTQRDKDGKLIPSVNQFQRKRLSKIDKYFVDPNNRPTKAWGISQLITDPLLQMTGIVKYEYNNGKLVRINKPINFVTNKANGVLDKSLDSLAGRAIKLKRVGKDGVNYLQKIKYDAETQKRRNVWDIAARIVVRIVIETIKDGIQSIAKTIDKVASTSQKYNQMKAYMKAGAEMNAITIQQMRSGLGFLGTVGGAITRSIPAAVVGALPGAYLGSKFNEVFNPIFGQGNVAGTVIGAFGGATIGGAAKFTDYLFSPVFNLGNQSRFQFNVNRFWGTGVNPEQSKYLQPQDRFITDGNGKLVYYGAKSMLSSYPMDMNLGKLIMEDKFYHFINKHSGRRILAIDKLRSFQSGLQDGTLKINSNGILEKHVSVNGIESWQPYQKNPIYAYEVTKPEYRNIRDVIKLDGAVKYSVPSNFEELLRKRGLRLASPEEFANARIRLESANFNTAELSRIDRLILSGRAIPLGQVSLGSFLKTSWKSMIRGAGIGAVAGIFVGPTVVGVGAVLATGASKVINLLLGTNIQVDFSNLVLPGVAAGIVGGALVGGLYPVYSRWFMPNMASFLSKESTFGRMMRAFRVASNERAWNLFSTRIIEINSAGQYVISGTNEIVNLSKVKLLSTTLAERSGGKLINVATKQVMTAAEIGELSNKALVSVQRNLKGDIVRIIQSNKIIRPMTGNNVVQGTRSLINTRYGVSALRSGMYAAGATTIIADALQTMGVISLPETILGFIPTTIAIGVGTLALGGLADFAVRRAIEKIGTLATNVLTKFTGSTLGRILGSVAHIPVFDALGLGVSIAQFNEIFVSPYNQLFSKYRVPLRTYLFGGEYIATSEFSGVSGEVMGVRVLDPKTGELISIDEAKRRGYDLTNAKTEVKQVLRFEGILNDPNMLRAFFWTVPMGIIPGFIGTYLGTRAFFFSLASKFTKVPWLNSLSQRLIGKSILQRLVEGNVRWAIKLQNSTNIFGRIGSGILDKLKFSAVGFGGLAGGIIGGFVGAFVLTNLMGIPLTSAVLIGSTVGAMVGGLIGTGITGILTGVGGAFAGIGAIPGFLLGTAINTVTTALGYTIGGWLGHQIDKITGRLTQALDLGAEAFSKLMAFFSLAKAYMEGDIAKFVMTVLQISMGAMVAGPAILTMTVIMPSIFTASYVDPKELVILPISTYVSKTFQPNSYDPKIPSVKFTITIDMKNLPQNGKGLSLNLTDTPDNAADISLQMLAPNGVSANGNNITIIGNYENSVTVQYEVKLKSKLDVSNGMCNHLTGSAFVYDVNNAEISRSQVNSSVCLDKNGSLINNTDIYTPVKIGRTPVNPGSVSQCFGENLTQYGKHQGMDIAVPSGTVVYAVDDAIVVRTGWDTSGGYFIQYKLLNESIYIIYYHLQTIAVSVGQEVKSGDAIGLADSTGAHTTGPHLHIEVRTTDAFNGTSTLVNPCYLQDATGKSICTNYPGGERCIPNLY